MRGVVLEGRAVRLRSKRFVHTAVDRRPTNRIEPLRPHQPPPVSRGWPTQVLNMASTFHSLGGDTSSPRFQKHLLRVADYLWVSEDGMKMQGYNGSQGWDASFVMQALAEADLVDEYASMCSKAYSYLERTQVRGRPLTAHGHQFSLPTATSFHCPRPPVFTAHGHQFHCPRPGSCLWSRPPFPSSDPSPLPPPASDQSGPSRLTPLVRAGARPDLVLAPLAREPGLLVRDAGDAPKVLSPRQRGRLALLELGSWVAHLRLHGGGVEGGARAA